MQRISRIAASSGSAWRAGYPLLANEIEPFHYRHSDIPKCIEVYQCAASDRKCADEFPYDGGSHE
jgi:hypothetical protein